MGLVLFASNWPPFGKLPLQWHSLYLIQLLLVILSMSTTTQANGLTKCDFEKFPGTGCAEQLTTICDITANDCRCKPGFSVTVQGTCMSYKNINEECYTSKQCVKIEAKCINTVGGEVKANDEDKDIPQLLNILLNLNSGFCQCPEGTYHNLDKRKCQRRVLGGKCVSSGDCMLKSHSYCDVAELKCKCEHGLFVDYLTDTCKTSGGNFMTNSGSANDNHINHDNDPHQHISSICEFGYIYDPSSQRCRTLVPHWDTARSWSSLVWKIAVLSIVLVLLMMLISGIQRARQNENLVNWSRALESYQSREYPGRDQIAPIRSRRAPTELRMMMGISPLTGPLPMTVQPIDDPPSYDEAVRMGATSAATSTVATTRTHNGNGANVGTTVVSPRIPGPTSDLDVSHQPP